MSDLLNIEKLKEWTGYERPSDVQCWLEKHGIPYMFGKGRTPVTTLQAINDRLLGVGKLEEFK